MSLSQSYKSDGVYRFDEALTAGRPRLRNPHPTGARRSFSNAFADGVTDGYALGDGVADDEALEEEIEVDDGVARPDRKWCRRQRERDERSEHRSQGRAAIAFALAPHA